MSRFFPEVKTNFFELKGETIKNIEAISTEYGRTYDLYILVNRRHLLDHKQNH